MARTFKGGRGSVKTPSTVGEAASSAPRLAPEWLLESMLFVALTAPNLFFSGAYWFQTLHLMKWFLAMIPVALLSVVVGWRLLRRGPEGTAFSLDPFGALWFLLLFYAVFQPLWAPVTSIPTLVREWFYLATLWAAYVWARHDFDGRRLSLFLLAAALNGAVNVLFAELQIRELNGPFPFILPTPGHYIGNTGQQNMLGIWIAIALYGGAFLHLVREGSRREGLVNLALFAVNAWGLWNTTSRSAYLSFFVGLAALSLVYGRLVGRKGLRRLLTILLILVATFFAAEGAGRGHQLVQKAAEMVRDVETVGHRDSIWLTSWAMFKKHPLTGVGLGHYKWNYLDAQRDMFRDHPDRDWKFTLWAHSEVLQFLCEFGLLGFLFLVGLGGWWLFSLLRALTRKKELSSAALWAIGLLFLFWFDALWTRPFHRIENVLWMSLAFALANRELLPVETAWSRCRPRALRVLGGLVTVVALAGSALMIDSMVGDRKIAVAMRSRSAQTRRELLERAHDHLLVRDIAAKQLAHHLVSIGEITKNREILLDGVLHLETVFRSEPHSQELRALLKWQGRLGRKEELMESVSYLKPGSYRIGPSSNLSGAP